jgi:steroid 5-alpha reductase family enzyme
MTSTSPEKKKIKPAPHRPVPALQCYLAYGAALSIGIVAWWFLQSRQIVENPYLIGLAVTATCTVVVWIFSIANDNSSIYDPYWVIAPPLLALALKANGGGGLFGAWHPRQIIIIAVLIVWASRYHIFYAWSGWRTGLVHEDWRYEAMREAPLPYWLNSLLGMHLFPTFLVYFAFAPAALVLISDPMSLSVLGVWDFLGLIGALSAVTIELVADRQLRNYRETGDYHRGGIFRRGLWKYSRHPNYFGESLFWVSMVPFAVSSGMLSRHVALVFTGPVLMALFFRFSCRLMDLRSLQRRPGYQEVIDEVSAMVPWKPKKKHYDVQKESIH